MLKKRIPKALTSQWNIFGTWRPTFTNPLIAFVVQNIRLSCFVPDTQSVFCFFAQRAERKLKLFEHFPVFPLATIPARGITEND